MDEQRSPFVAPETIARESIARDRSSSPQLAICFGIAAALGTWLLGDAFPNELHDALFIGVASSAIIGATLGYFLSRRPVNARNQWATFVGATIGAGAANGLLCGTLCGATIGHGSSDYQVIPVFGVCGSLLGAGISAVCFLAPFAFVYGAYARVNQAREGSLLRRANVQRVYFATAAIVFAAASIANAGDKSHHNGHGLIVIVAVATIVVLWAMDLLRIARFFGNISGVSQSTEYVTQGQTRELDLGIGTERWTSTASQETAYRSRPRVVTAVYGSIESTRRALSGITWIDSVVAVSAIVVCIYSELLAPSAAKRAEAAPSYTSQHPVSVEQRSLSFYPQPGPIVTDINADGIEDVLGLSWDSSHEDAAITVIAIDGKSLRVLWTSSPVKSQWASPRIHLVRSRDNLFLTDSEGRLHVYDIFTGKQIVERANPMIDVGSDSICGAEEGEARIWMIADHAYGIHPHGVLVNANGKDTETDKPAWCHIAPDGDRPCNETGSGTCITYDAPVSSGSHLLRGYGLEEDGIGVGIGPLTDGERGKHLVGYDPKTHDVRWEGSVAFTDDVLHSDPQIHNQLKFGRFYSLYQKQDGRWTIGARDASTGQTLWSKEPPGSLRGTRFGSMTITETRLYLVVDWRVDVFDSKTGAQIGVIW